MPSLALGNRPAQRLRSIARDLARQSDAAALANIAMQDVSALRASIRLQVEHSSQHSKPGASVDIEMVTDQLLFLMLGARSMQVRAQDAQSWKLVHAAINSLLRPPGSRSQRIPLWLAASGSLLILALITSMWMPGPAVKHHQTEISVAPLATINEVAPATLTVLQTVYRRMKDGNCQLPQAAMLPMEQRQPFMAFLYGGKVDIADVDNLKASLLHVHCLYTKKQLPPY